jgi:hypothetical protein
MPEDKKIDKDKLPRPEKEERKHQNQEEFDDKSKAVKHNKPKKTNYIIKDLPIY